MECCNNLYTRKFDDEKAWKEMKDYRIGKIRKNSRPLIRILSELELNSKSLIDIGGGVGVVSFELLKKGVSKVTHIEFSEGYKKAFNSECERLQVIDKVISLQGDYTKLYSKVEMADLVCLDKVICCYDNYKELISTSCIKSRKWYAYVIPRDTWWVHAVAWLAEGVRILLNDPFRSYIHPQAEIENMVLQAGFTKLIEQNNSEWVTVVFERASVS